VNVLCPMPEIQPRIPQALPNLPIPAIEGNNDLMGADGDMAANDGQTGQV
jgi:hypothetical protein